ncbi:MAG: FHA domain-containing protein, partial [Streptosporangiaceae bacterium]|nr:FHA domain-containing protein [Streptosporangiaceae bacterium]
MGRSAADTPTSPEFLRVSDAERERAIDDLKQEFVDGRLSHDTFLLRMQAALGARNSGQLAGILRDLPPRRTRLARAGEAARKLGRNTRAVFSEGAAALADGAAALADGAAALAEPFRAVVRRPPLDAIELPLHGVPPETFVPAPRPAAPLVFPPGEPGDGASFTIGRDQECDLYIPDMTVSRLHARLVREAQGWLLTDLGSTNGTRLNGWRVRTAVPVRAGDQIRFGSAEF